MEVVLLGTGAADGWPNPFCSCASCTTLRGRGEVRGQTSALLDTTLLLDCGPEAPSAASRAGRDLTGVRHVLLTHAHPDHAGPAALLWRSWARRPEPLVVHGPADAVGLFRDWVGPDDPVQLHPVRAGDRLDADGYDVRVLAADHEVETVCYDVTGRDGERLLYATDTGPLPASTLEVVAGRAYDLLLLEETFGDRFDHGTRHLDLRSFPAVLADLRAVGATTARTEVVAIHLGHRNPPDLATRLAAWGARVVPDGTVLTVGRQEVGLGGPRGTARRLLVLGGARSGKSAYAETTLSGEPGTTYVATGGTRPDDPGWAERIGVHRDRRQASWTTVETTDLEPLLRTDGPPLLVDCLALWLTAVLDEVSAWEADRWTAGGRDALTRRVDGLVDALAGTRRRVVVVSNEVGSGVVPAHASGRLFRDELGRLNAGVAAVVDEAVLLVAGRAVRLPAAPVPGTGGGSATLAAAPAPVAASAETAADGAGRGSATEVR